MELLYATTEMDTLVFVPAPLATELIAIHEQTAAWSTWGDARRDLEPARFGELSDLLWVGPAPNDDTPIELEDLIRDGPWPQLRSVQMHEWLPPGVLDQFGDEYATMMSSGVNLPCDCEEDIVAALQKRGIGSAPDDRVADLFADSD